MACPNNSARELIINSFYTAGIASRTFETVTGEQITQGLRLLNDLLAEQAITGSLIPYYQEYSLTAVVGQEKYFIPDLIEVETFTFNIGPVRYSMENTQRKRYFGTGRSDNIESLPHRWHVERTLNGSDLYIYFLPSQAYPMKIWGKFGFDEITDLCTDLSLVYDRFYRNYLQYALAEYLCSEYNKSLKPNAEKILRRLEKKLEWVSPMDLSMNKRSTLTRRNRINYGDVNLGQGWRP
jgi:hypothetical protein